MILIGGFRGLTGASCVIGGKPFDNVFSTQSACDLNLLGPQVDQKVLHLQISESQNYTQKLRSHVLASCFLNLLESLENTRGVFMVCLPCNL